MCYAGETPNIEYYSDHLLDSEDLFGKDNKAIDKLKREKYKSVYKDKWSLQEECLKYGARSRPRSWKKIWKVYTKF